MNLQTLILYEILSDIVPELEARIGHNFDGIVNRQCGLAWVVYHNNKKFRPETDLSRKHVASFIRMHWEDPHQITIQHPYWNDAGEIGFKLVFVDTRPPIFLTDMCDTIEPLIRHCLSVPTWYHKKGAFGSSYYGDIDDFALVPT